MSALYVNEVAKPNEILWTFAAPDDTKLVNTTLWRAARTSVDGGAYTWVVDTDALPYRWLEWCTDYQLGCHHIGSLDDPLSPTNRAEFAGLHARYLFTHLNCAGLAPELPCRHPSGAEAKIFGARVGLLDQVSPELEPQLDGTLIDATSPQEGVRSLSFAATDRGGGIAAVGLIADGRTVLDRPPDPGDARCRQPYVSRVPCPLSTSVTLTFDTAALVNGSHVLQAFATDVSGNRSASTPFTITTRNGSTPNGIGASRAVRLTASLANRTGKSLRGAIRYGQSTVLRGSLTTLENAPIPGAALDVLVRVSRPGSIPHPRTVTTDSKGRYAYRVPGGASRDIDVAYRAFALDEGYSAMATAKLRVRASITLSTSRRSLRNGQRVRFRGRLVGGPRRQDASMILYALGDRRIPVTSLKADSRGRFSYTYRFRTVRQRSIFRFQVRTESRPGYPYTAGASRTVQLAVRP
jgi:hypothetical protein